MHIRPIAIHPRQSGLQMFLQEYEEEDVRVGFDLPEGEARARIRWQTE